MPVSRPAALALLLLVGCAEDPSFQLAWRISDDPAALDDPSSAPALVSVKQCSDVGIAKVRVTVLTPEGAEVDAFEYGCFQRPFAKGEPIDGPTLEPGEYRLKFEGLRRTGDIWVTAMPEGPAACEIPEPATDTDEYYRVCNEGSVVVREGDLPLVEFALLAPPQCDDGIDNDLDGQVDDKDLACQLDAAANEVDEQGLTLFELSVGFLQSSVIEPSNVGVDELRFSLDGEPWTPSGWPNGALAELDETHWPFPLTVIRASLEPGEHTLSVEAYGDGVPLTEPLSETFLVDADDGASVVREFQFGAEQFLSPVMASFATTIQMVPYVGAPAVTCDPPGQQEIDRLRVRVLDGQGTPVADDVLALSTFPTGTLVKELEADGWISFACPSTAVDSAPLIWTDLGYTLEVEAQTLVDDVNPVTCYTTSEPAALVPFPEGASPENVYLSAVLDDQGAPPPGCEACTEPAECGGGLTCQNNRCVPE